MSCSPSLQPVCRPKKTRLFITLCQGAKTIATNHGMAIQDVSIDVFLGGFEAFELERHFFDGRDARGSMQEAPTEALTRDRG